MLTVLTATIEQVLNSLFSEYLILAFFFLFIIIFIETGVVFAPFLPGDSLLFLAGTIISVKPPLYIVILFGILSLAAILGDNLNYLIGKLVGKKLLQKGLVKQERISKTNEFFAKYGNKTIVLARFIPFVRTIAPFVAGIGKMNYSKFLIFNIVGGISWVFLFLFSGYFFGNIPIVKQNLSEVILIIVLISLIPIAYEFIKSRIRKSK